MTLEVLLAMDDKDLDLLPDLKLGAKIKLREALKNLKGMYLSSPSLIVFSASSCSPYAQ